jgi:hypothetical protein
LQDGTYLRNGPGLWNLGDYGFRHLFDGYATLVRVSFRDGQAVGAHRQIESEAYKAARAHGKVCYREFSEVPKAEGFLSHVGQLATLFSGSSLTDNSNTGVVRLGDGRVLCLTETIKGSIVVDPDTLDTIGKFEYTDRLGGLIHSAHPIVTDTEFWTLIPDLIRPGYSVVRMDAGTNERRFVGRVDCRGGPAPGWVHSFPITDHYVVVPEMPLRYCARNLLRAEPTPLYKFEWHLESGSYMHVMCKASGRVVATVEVPPFVTFHFINAYEEKDDEGRVTAIIADCCEHNANTSILDKLRLQNLRSSTGQDVLPDARYGTKFRSERERLVSESDVRAVVLGGTGRDIQGGPLQDPAGREPVRRAGAGAGPGPARPRDGHVQHQPGPRRQEVPVRLRLRSPPAVQLPQHPHQDRPGGEDGQELVRGGRRAVRALLRAAPRRRGGGRRLVFRSPPDLPFDIHCMQCVPTYIWGVPAS